MLASATSPKKVPGHIESSSDGSAMAVGRFMELGSGNGIQRGWSPRPIVPPYYHKMGMNFTSKSGINTSEVGMQLQPYQPKPAYARQIPQSKGTTHPSPNTALESPAPQHPTSTGPPVINFPFLEVCYVSGTS